MKNPNTRESVANKIDLRKLRSRFKSHSERKCMAGKKNSNYVNGEGEQYSRIRIDDTKVRTSHIRWRLAHKKKIPIGYNIHHKDENKRNDRPSNLKLIKSKVHGNLNLKKRHDK